MEKLAMDKKLDKYIEEALFYYDLTGLAVSVGRGDYIYRKSVGYGDFEKKEKLKGDEFFHLASVSKTFVAMSIMKLVEESKITLETRLIDVLPWIKIKDERLNSITIKNLLTHTAGLGDVEDYGWARPRFDDKALSDYVKSKEVTESRLIWAPEENKFKYSNIGYEILGVIIKEISGISFEEYIKENFFVPLEMNNSTFLTFERGIEILKKEAEHYTLEEALGLELLKKAGGAMPHYKDEENHIHLEKQYPYNREHGPSSTLTSDLYDIEKWARAIMSKTLIDDELYNEIWTGQTIVPNNGEEMGLGWFIRKQKELTFFGHEGNDDGFRASFWICPEKEAFVTVMSNISKAPVKKISKGVFEVICWN